jgi:hypothetical protein
VIHFNQFTKRFRALWTLQRVVEMKSELLNGVVDHIWQNYD